MPRRPPVIRQRAHYSRDLLDRIVYQRLVLGLSTREIARLLNINRRTVQRTLQTFDEIGEVCRPNSGRSGRRRILVGELREFMLATVEERPHIYLDELRDAIQQHFGVSVHLSTVWRALKLFGLTLKQLSHFAAQRVEQDRDDFRYILGLEQLDWLVFCDETSIDMRATYRLYGWAKKGKRACLPETYVRGKRLSILPALSVDGLLFSQVREGTFDGDAFVSFLEGLLPCMNPYPGPRSVLVMDNCNIHHVEGVSDLCEEYGVKLIYLPAYSPDLNPIEAGFSAFKADGRRNKVAFRAALEAEDRLQTVAYINEMLGRAFTPQNARAWFRHSNYF